MGKIVNGVYIPNESTQVWRQKPIIKKRTWRKPSVNSEEEAGCNSIQKKKYKPDCATDPKEKDRRRQRINEVVREYERMKQKERSKFMRKIHERTAEEWWITSHYYVDFPFIQTNGNGRDTVTGEIKYSKRPIRGSHRQNVQNQITLQNLENIKLNKVPNSRSQLSRMLQIFESKLSFHYDKHQFMMKIEEMDRFMRERGITILNLINDDFFLTFGNDEIENILGDEVYHFLKRNGILTRKLINQYEELFAIDEDENRRMKLKQMWYKSYTSRIEILFAILTIPRENEDVFIYNVENILKMELTMRIYQYIYYSNNYLKDENLVNGKTKEFMIEIVFEYVYYNYLNYYLNFCKFLLGCTDKVINNSKILGKGAIGNIYKTETITGETIIEKRTNDARQERMLFEFFKQICLYEMFGENITEPIQYIFGRNDIYIQMREIEGENVLKYILEDREFIGSTEEDKYEMLKNISIEISTVLMKFQDKIKFIHYDFNPRNIMIKVERKKENRRQIDRIKVIFIDFDKTFFEMENTYIYTFNRFLYKNMFESNNFYRSIDLFRYIAEICNIKNNISTLKSNKYKNLRNNETEGIINNSIGQENLKKIILKFFDIRNENISNKINRIMMKINKIIYFKYWDIYLSSMKGLREEVFREINRELVPPISNLYIDRFIPTLFNEVW